MWIEKKMKKKKKEKIKQNKNLDVKQVELILIVQKLIYMLKLVKCTVTLMNQIKNILKNQLKNL